MIKTLFPKLGPNKVVFLFVLGLFLIVLSFYLNFAGFPIILNQKIKASIALNNGTEAMKAFENLPEPLEFRIYLFNVTNPEEVTQGARPLLQEVGPYVYDEFRKKDSIQMVDDDLVTYKVEKTYFFNKNKSGCHKESDVVTVLNIPLMGTGYMVEERFPMGLTFLNSALPYMFPNISSPFLSAAVGDLLFSGTPIRCSYETGPAMPVCRGIKANLPPPIREIPDTKDFAFSIFQAINGTPSGLFKVYRGNLNIYDLGKIVEYNNMTYLSMWDKNSTCSQLKGTDSSILPPVYNYDDIYLYLPEVCLSLRASYMGQTDMYGIPVYKYVSASNNFASPTEVKENVCRCRKVEDKKDPICLKSGAIDATKCQGAPVILTPPHFLQCDPEYQNYPEGLSPEKSKHETQVFLEPKTGVPVAAYKRIQMNMFLKKLEGIDILANVSEGLFPLVWVEEAIADEMLNTFLPSLKELMGAIKIMNSVLWLLGGIGLLCTVLSGIFYMKHKNMVCFKDNQVVSNIALGSSSFTTKTVDFMDEKRTMYNIPITPGPNDNNFAHYSSADIFDEKNARSLKGDQFLPS